MTLYSCSFIDESSFYNPIEGKKEFHPQEIEEIKPDLELRQEKLRKMTEKMRRILSPERINEYVAIQLGSRNEMKASELALESIDDFMKLIYVRLYGTRRNMKYRIERIDEKNKVSNNFDFPDFVIKKNERSVKK